MVAKLVGVLMISSLLVGLLGISSTLAAGLGPAGPALAPSTPPAGSSPAVLTSLFQVPAVRATQPGLGRPAKVEPLLWDQLQVGGEADLIVRLAEQADLTAAYQIQDWEARGEYVYEALQTVAERSQAQVKALLDGANLPYQTMIAGNELYVWNGTLLAAAALAELPEVDFIRATRTYQVDPIIEQEAPAEPDALAWGISYTHADQFWASLGLEGDGIKVAGIDTGVQYDHPALDQAFACPGQPGNAACWYDPANICGGTACDNNGHGTHTMGTMVADNDPTLTYQAGMAPDATWIACKGCESGSCSDFALNACADWILAPAGNPANRPHVVNNSWGGGACDTWYLPKVQAWRAAGIFPAFSAGNNGTAGCTTLGTPGDYQESFTSASIDASGTIASSSSRGPSCFGHEPYTKPNIAAPGVSVCSTIPTDSWSCGYSGTSMATPHSAGAVALLWSCNPALIGQIDLTFEILQATAGATPAGNCGAPPDGEGNYTYGYGYLDIYAAGAAACTSAELDVYLPVVLVNYPWDLYCEPNNSKGTAYGPLLPGISFQAYPDDGNDYYYFTLSSAKTVDFLVSNFVPTSEFGDLLIYNAVDAAPIAQFGLSGHTEMWINDLSLEAGKYYIQVYTVSGHFSNTHLYTLRLTY